MTTTGKFVMCAMLVAAIAVAACSGDDGAHAGQGVVQEVGTGSRQVTIEHGDIPGLMTAMTMTFEVADPFMLVDIEPGDRVDFRVRHADGVYTVVAISER